MTRHRKIVKIDEESRHESRHGLGFLRTSALADRGAGTKAVDESTISYRSA
jgi:hypothetical protein